ncbi:MAG: hypothetical protein RIQ79_376 [Verrucomicrobiota bacterium]
MNAPAKRKIERAVAKPISVGLSCWLWERGHTKKIQSLGARIGVNLQITEHIHGLRRDIKCQVTGKNVDQFIGEFARNC